ncbi:hypothetical protein MKX01_018061 [Papaver californicum]|nr:hypothetical protein MKX01_018061 [Papaver californicum]
MGFRFPLQFFFITHCLLKYVKTEQFYNSSSSISTDESSSIDGMRVPKSRCNVFHGSWIIDSSYPLYDFSNCPFIDPEFNCKKYGRPDNLYLRYRWKPTSCDIPRFLEEMEREEIMFVGDSLSLNQWQSLTCLIHASLPISRLLILLLQNQQYHTSYLVHMVRDKVRTVLKLDSIEDGNAWRGMDMLIFNTWQGTKKYKDMDRLIAFYKGLSTWGRWIDRNVDPSRTKVFFQGISPTHYEGREWNGPSKTCKGQTQPVSGSSYPSGLPAAALVVNRVFARIQNPVYLLDVTMLSQMRKDAHPTSYNGDHKGIDCSHWCLPGLPDTWNQLLYAALIH